MFFNSLFIIETRFSHFNLNFIFEEIKLKRFSQDLQLNFTVLSVYIYIYMLIY